MRLRLLLLCLAGFALPATAFAETYYIDGEEGDDGYDGLAQSSEGGDRGPRRTWAWFAMGDAGGLEAGDRVLFKRGTIVNGDDAGIVMRCSNMEDVYFGAYGDESLPNPILDSRGRVGLYIGWNGPTHNLTFEDLTFMTSVPRPSGSIITAFSDDSPGSAEGVTFRRIEVDATNQTGLEVSDETITFAADNVTIEDCYLHGPGRDGIYVAGQNNVIQRNRVEGFQVGIKLNSDGWRRPRRNVIRRNWIIANLVGIELAEADHCDVYSNIISEGDNFSLSFFIGIQLEDDEFGDDEPGAEFMNVFNNTLIFNGESVEPYYAHRDDKGQDAVGLGNVFQNNLVYIYNAGSRHYFTEQRRDALLPAMNNNLYFSDGPTQWRRDDMTYESLATWSATAAGPDSNSAVADPLFVTDPDGAGPGVIEYHLQVGSPAIDSGAAVEMHTEFPFEDFNGNGYIGAPDIGAFEFGVEPTCAGELCESGQECAGGTFDGLCCVGGSCTDAGDAGPAADGGPGADGGSALDAGTANDGGSLDGSAADAGPPDDDAGCSCSVGTRQPASPFAFLMVATFALRRLRRKF